MRKFFKQQWDLVRATLSRFLPPIKLDSQLRAGEFGTFEYSCERHISRLVGVVSSHLDTVVTNKSNSLVQIGIGFDHSSHDHFANQAQINRKQDAIGVSRCFYNIQYR